MSHWYCVHCCAVQHQSDRCGLCGEHELQPIIFHLHHTHEKVKKQQEE
ncbi:hypothetical protein [Bacillus fonticola]|nr:hypothetical protein [Bacillus fonticola]